MSPRPAVSFAGLAASAVLALGQGDRPPLQLVEVGVRVEPVRVARAWLGAGRAELIGDWLPYTPASGMRECVRDERVFECYGDENYDGEPDDPGGCGMGAARWSLGTSYCNGFVTNDMRDDNNGGHGLWRCDTAWYWTGPGDGSPERCIVGVWTQESDPSACEEDSGDYSGWVFDFGELASNPGHYYYANMDISGMGTWPVPTSSDGSYIIAFFVDAEWHLASCAQPMLWGASNSVGGDPRGPGEQGPLQLDDDSPQDSMHTAEECHAYALGWCPDPLGAMAQFWGETGVDWCLSDDCTRDGIWDTRDIVCFLRLWAAGDDEADCDYNGVLDSRDVACFLNDWVICSCRG